MLTLMLLLLLLDLSSRIQRRLDLIVHVNQVNMALNKLTIKQQKVEEEVVEPLEQEILPNNPQDTSDMLQEKILLPPKIPMVGRSAKKVDDFVLSGVFTSSSTASMILFLMYFLKLGLHRSGFSSLIPLMRSIPKFKWMVSSRKIYWNCSPIPVILF